MNWRTWLAGCMALVPLLGAAQEDATGERRRLAAQLQEADARFEREQADCRQRFALNACADEARARHRQLKAELKSQQRALDERQRQQRAAGRQAAIEQRQQTLQARPPLVDSPTSAPQAASAAARPAKPKAARDEAAAQAKAAERAAAARKLQAAIQADQARIKARQAQREAQGKKAQPLPPPASAPP